MDKREVYADYNASTPVHAEVAEAMLPFLRGKYGNPSSIHCFGRRSRAALDAARDQVARLINALPEEIYFTSGGTEAINMALRGTGTGTGGHYVVSAIEHHAVLNTCAALTRCGITVSRWPVDAAGRIVVSDFAGNIRQDTVLIAVMYANNEIGTIQPVRDLGRRVREISQTRKRPLLFFCDAVQAAGRIPVDVKADAIDLLAISGHKMYGPKGVGALYVRKGIRLAPLLTGGSQERNLRAGTENVPGIVGLGAAAELTRKSLARTAVYLQELKDMLVCGIKESIEGVTVNSPLDNCLPNTVNISFSDVVNESVIINCDLHGIAVSASSACTSGMSIPSHVLHAIGCGRPRIQGAVRFSFGTGTKKDDIAYILAVLPQIIAACRQGGRYDA